MKLKIKVKVNDDDLLPNMIEIGDWVDLKSEYDYNFKPTTSGVLKETTFDGERCKFRKVDFNYGIISLGIAMQLPEGFEAVIAPRSSTPFKFGIMCANSIGIIDNSYSGNDDIWKFPFVAIDEVHIEKGDRICQFRIQLTQKATIWQKLKWFFCTGIEFIKVEELSENNRGGIGTTGTK